MRTAVFTWIAMHKFILLVSSGCLSALCFMFVRIIHSKLKAGMQRLSGGYRKLDKCNNWLFRLVANDRINKGVKELYRGERSYKKGQMIYGIVVFCAVIFTLLFMFTLGVYVF